MKSKKLASLVAVCLAAGTFAVTASALSPNGREFYIPKTISSTASETTTTDLSMLSFKVTKILKADHSSSDYKRIRIKLTGPSGTMWYPGTGFSTNLEGYCTKLTAGGQQTFTFKAYKNRYCEVATGDTIYGTYRMYYYGNNPNLNAYATIESYGA